VFGPCREQGRDENRRGQGGRSPAHPAGGAAEARCQSRPPAREVPLNSLPWRVLQLYARERRGIFWGREGTRVRQVAPENVNFLQIQCPRTLIFGDGIEAFINYSGQNATSTAFRAHFARHIK